MTGDYPVNVLSGSLFTNKQKWSEFTAPFILSRPDLQEVIGCGHQLARKKKVIIFRHYDTEYTN